MHRWYKSVIIIILIFITFIPSSFSQTYNRIEAEFTVKEKKHNGEQQLSMGHVYYDQHYEKIVYNIYFPEKSKLVMTRDAMILIENDTVIKRQPASHLVKFSIFNLSIQGSLAYFGLKQTPFELKDVEQDGEMVISTWELPEDMVESKSKIMLSQVNKQLQGIIIFDKNDEIISKQFFENYTTIKGLNFPQRVVQFSYVENGKKNTRITTYKNIKINQTGNEALYNYSIPGN
ncbi:MAG: hypothetical protein ACOCPM_01140 [Bacteroidales bacterium]